MNARLVGLTGVTAAALLVPCLSPLAKKTPHLCQSGYAHAREGRRKDV
jgi:hypothetical protein